MTFPKYPKYQDSGVAWLGQIPHHWQAEQSRRLFRVRNEPALPGDQQLTASQKYGVLFQTDFVQLEGRRVVETLMGTDTLRHVEPDDFIISLRSFQGGIEWSRLRGSSTFHYVVLVPVKHVHPPFFARLFKSTDYIQALRTTTDLIRDGQDLRFSHFVQVDLPVIPIDEQMAIAEFLDHETAKIDELVAEQQRLVELLEEKRQAVISYAVTKGLDPNVKFKPSGIDWLGDVPVHWEVCSVRRVIVQIEQGWSPECHSRTATPEEWGVLKTGCVNRGVLNEDENKALPDTLSPLPEYEVKAGDVLMSRASGSPDLVGSTAYVSSIRPRLMLSDKTFRIHLEPAIAKRFFVAAFNSRFLRSQIERAISGAEGLANNLPQSALLTFAICVPPIKEQAVIVQHLDRETGKLDALIAETERAVSLLQERRTALISAAVTGKIDVREIQADYERRSARFIENDPEMHITIIPPLSA